MERRQRIGLHTASIIGYTNAGKTSLFNKLTGKKKYVKNELFATLDSSVGKIYLPNIQQEILISDTIGFIQNLPTKLIDAFKSTLMESMHADLLLHVTDTTDEDKDQKIQTVEKILADLNLTNKKRLYVFNKTENTSSEQINTLIQKYQQFSPQFISVKTGQGITSLLQAIESF